VSAGDTCPTSCRDSALRVACNVAAISVSATQSKRRYDRRSVRPGRAPVCAPSRTTCAPFTKTCAMPAGRMMRILVGGDVRDPRGVEHDEIRERAGPQLAATLDAELAGREAGHAVHAVSSGSTCSSRA